jgi:uncharacterized membrane protein
MPPQTSSDSSPTPDSRNVKPFAVPAELGRHLFGLGIMAIGLACLAWGDFIAGQIVPNDFPHRTALAYTAAAFLLITGVLLQWRKSAAIAAATLATYYLVIVIIVMHGPVLLARFKVYGPYEGLAQQFAIAAAALIVYAATAPIPASLAARLTLVSQRIFGLCAIIFGGAHFVYMNFTAPLVPKWLPPSQVFWGYLTGVAFILAGLAILSRTKARLAAILLTAMFACFTFLVHLRMLFADHKTRFNWTELAINLAILGAAWVLADSFTSLDR